MHDPYVEFLNLRAGGLRELHGYDNQSQVRARGLHIGPVRRWAGTHDALPTSEFLFHRVRYLLQTVQPAQSTVNVARARTAIYTCARPVHTVI